jgi:hypothetical protein
MAAVVAAHMSSQQPLHPATQLPVLSWPQNKMKVIRHQAVRDDAHGDTLARGRNKSYKFPIVDIPVEDVAAGIATVEDVVADTSDRSAGGARHGDRLTKGDAAEQK